MQKGDPSWSGYIYAFSIFAGVVWIIFVSCMLCTTFLCCFGVAEPTIIVLTTLFIFQSLGVLAEAQYFQNVMRVGFRLRSTLVCVSFRILSFI